MRILQLLIAVVCIGIGVLFGALNAHTTSLDFGILTLAAAPVGLSLLVALLVGALLGGLVLELGVVWPLRRRLRNRTEPATPASARVPQDPAAP